MRPPSISTTRASTAECRATPGGVRSASAFRAIGTAEVVQAAVFESVEEETSARIVAAVTAAGPREAALYLAAS